MGESRFPVCFVLIYFLFVISFPEEKGGNVSPLPIPASQHTHQGSEQGVLQKNEAGNLLLLTLCFHFLSSSFQTTLLIRVLSETGAGILETSSCEAQRPLFPTQFILYIFLS